MRTRLAEIALTTHEKCARMRMLTTGTEGVLFYERRQAESDILGKTPPIKQGISSRQLSATTAKLDRGLAMSKRIPLTQGRFAIVDDTDFEWLNQWKWHARKCRGKVYAARRRRKEEGTGSEIMLMHREILGTPPGMDSDHINRDTLDNRRSNLSESWSYRGS